MNSRPIFPRIAVLCLAALPLMGAGPQPSAKEADPIEQLDAVEVTAARITPPQRAIPMPVPDMSAAVPLPSEGIGVQGQQEPAHPVVPPSRNLLRDDTASTKGIRTRARYLDSMRPPYPKRAREMGWEGTVVLRVEVKADGTVGAVAVQRTSGHAILDESAATAVKRWRFEPPTDGAFSLSAVVDVPIRFDLRDTMGETGQGS